jgi:glycosyltransferase involved in cell wall biosynthesis
MRVICLNNYPLEKATRMADEGTYPRQHLWGTDALRATGDDVVLAPFLEPTIHPAWTRVHEATRYGLGSFDQQAFALRHLARGSVIYSADARSATGLALASRLFDRHPPVVCVVHHASPPRRLLSAASRSYAHLLCLTRHVADDLVRVHGVRPNRVTVAGWGPDLSFAGYQPPPARSGLHLVCAGKSNRDLRTLVAGLSGSRAEAIVYDLDDQLGGANVPRNVTVIGASSDGADPATRSTYYYEPVLNRLRQANAIAVPIRDVSLLTGLTEINDALALGLPFVVTATAYLPFDPEAVGCGIVVEWGDVNGWRRALERLSDDTERAAMGAAGRRFAEEHWNYRRFCDAVVAAIHDVRG